MSYSTQIGLGFIFAVIALLFFFALHFRRGAQNASNAHIALNALNVMWAFVGGAILLIVVAVIIGMVVP